MKISHPLILAMSLAAPSISAQHVSFAAHELGRGYYDAPYLRYEAEPGRCTTDGTFLEPLASYTQQPLHAEASNEAALTLKKAGEFVEWNVDEAANGLTVRFSVPDSEKGNGQKADIKVLIDGKEAGTLTLNSYWSWQYTDIANTPEKYSDRKPGANRFARMRFDEATMLLKEYATKGSKIRLEKAADDGIDITIDFIELEDAGQPLTAADFPGEDVVVYEGSGYSLESFISKNQGKRIILAPGIYELDEMLTLSHSGTKLSGSGMWYTTLHFTADGDSRLEIGNRGVVCDQDNVEFTDMSLTTVSRVRYYPGSTKGSGKALSGSWGKNSVIKNIRADHFECGAWIANYGGRTSENLTVTGCRFRNNYADGINLCQGSIGAKVTHCSFRNNGDDDMASWSAGAWARNHEFAYCTAENNWRASSLGFFGGEGHNAHHLLVIDGMEGGIRANGEFNGTGFSTEGECAMTDITIINCGCISGTPGTQGGFWGSATGAVDILSGTFYDVNNLRLENIDVTGSRGHAIHLGSKSMKKINNLTVKGVNIDGHGDDCWSFWFENTKGNGTFSDINYSDNSPRHMSKIPTGFTFDGEFSNLTSLQTGEIKVYTTGNALTVSSEGDYNGLVSLYTANGLKISEKACSAGSRASFGALTPGLYIVNASGCKTIKVLVK